MWLAKERVLALFGNIEYLITTDRSLGLAYDDLLFYFWYTMVFLDYLPCSNLFNLLLICLYWQLHYLEISQNKYCKWQMHHMAKISLHFESSLEQKIYTSSNPHTSSVVIKYLIRAVSKEDASIACFEEVKQFHSWGHQKLVNFSSLPLSFVNPQA